MIDSLRTKYFKDGRDYEREVEFGPMQSIINKYLNKDVEFVVYRLSYAGKYLTVKGKTLAGSLIMLADTYASFENADSNRFKGHLYTHFFKHLKTGATGRFTVKILGRVCKHTDYLGLLKIEQRALDAGRYDKNCLNNQIEVYIPLYNQFTNMYGWLPGHAVLNFKKWLSSAERKGFLATYKK